TACGCSGPDQLRPEMSENAEHAGRCRWFDGQPHAGLFAVQQGRYTAGVATHYAPSMLCQDGRYQHLAEGFTIGMRFHSAPVVRLADAKPVQLGHTVEADGRWRLFLFNNREDPRVEGSLLRNLCTFLESSDTSPVRR